MPGKCSVSGEGPPPAGKRPQGRSRALLLLSVVEVFPCQGSEEIIFSMENSVSVKTARRLEESLIFRAQVNLN